MSADLPPLFAELPAELAALYDPAAPWALLVNNGERGPFATHIPLILDRGRGPHGTLVGHIARANPHADALARVDTPALAVFQGPYAYVSPTWYPNRDMPGTYYYMAVHCYGSLTIQSEAELEKSLHVLNDRMELDIPNPWQLAEIPHSEITRRLPAIMGFELRIERLESKLKLGQDEPKKDALAVAGHLADSDHPSHRLLAREVERVNADRPDDDS